MDGSIMCRLKGLTVDIFIHLFNKLSDNFPFTSQEIFIKPPKLLELTAINFFNNFNKCQFSINFKWSLYTLYINPTALRYAKHQFILLEDDLQLKILASALALKLYHYF